MLKLTLCSISSKSSIIIGGATSKVFLRILRILSLRQKSESARRPAKASHPGQLAIIQYDGAAQADHLPPKAFEVFALIGASQPTQRGHGHFWGWRGRSAPFEPSLERI